MSRKRLLVLGLTIIVGLSAFWFWDYRTDQQPHNTLSPIAQAPKGGNFILQSDNGPVQLSDFKGKWVYLYFGYTFCPDICPTNLGNLSVAYHQLTDQEKSKIQLLFVSVDPDRDTPSRLAEYSNYFEMNLIGITGSPEDIKKISHNYGAVFISHKKSADDKYYPVDHSAFTYVINPEGKLVGQLPHGTGPEMFIKNIRHNLHSIH